MNAGLHILKKLVLWSVAVVFALGATVFAINSRDERLSPKTVSLLTAPPDLYPTSDNLYFMLAGFETRPGGSVIAAGQAAVRAYERKLRKGPDAFLHLSDRPSPDALVFKGNVTGFWQSTTDVWGEVDSHKTQIAQLLVANRKLYQRYRALHRATGYYETGTPSVYATTYFPPLPLRHVFLADFALRMRSGNREEQSAALADMANDLQVWRTMLTGYGSLISKMIAVAYLRQDLILIGDMIADPAVALSDRRSEMDRLVTPFPIHDWKLGSAFSYEARITTREIADTYSADSAKEAHVSFLENTENWLLEPFYKKHATENEEADNTRKIIAIVDGPPRLLQQAISTYGVAANCLANVRIGCVYNPIGKILVAVAIPAYERFPLEAYDVAALQRMVKLAYEIRVHQVTSAAIPRYMKLHPEWSRHPVNGRAFMFNAVTDRLSLERLARRQDSRHFSIPAWRPAS